MENTLLTSTQLYWKTRNKSQGSWNSAMENIAKTEEYQSMVNELMLLNKVRKSHVKTYRCTYEIHPDDITKANFEEYDRGSYIDSIQRCCFVGRKIISSPDNLDGPLPGKPSVHVITIGTEEEFDINLGFVWSKCFVPGCDRDHRLPTGYFCEKHIDNLKFIKHEDGSFNIQDIEMLILNRMRQRMDRFREENKSEPKLDECIEINCWSCFKEFDEEDEVIIRVILVSAVEMKVCSAEHKFSGRFEPCSNCDMYPFEY